MACLRRSIGPGVGAALLVLLGSGIGWTFATRGSVRAPQLLRSRAGSRVRGERHPHAALSHTGYSVSWQRVQEEGLPAHMVRPAAPLPETLLVIAAPRPQPRPCPAPRFTIRPPPPA